MVAMPARLLFSRDDTDAAASATHADAEVRARLQTDHAGDGQPAGAASPATAAACV